MISGSALNTMKTAANQSKRLGRAAIGIEGWASGNGNEKDKKEKEKPSPRLDASTMLKTIADIDPTLPKSPTNLGNTPLNTQAAWLDNWFAQRSKKFGFKFNPEVVKPIFDTKLPHSASGEFNPINKEIRLNPDVPNSAEKSTFLHEKTHYYQDKHPVIEQYAKGWIPEILKNNETFKAGAGTYDSDPDEIYARLNQLRYEEKIDPNQTITLDFIKTLSPEKRKKYKLDYSDQELMELLNKTVSVQKKDTSNLA